MATKKAILTKDKIVSMYMNYTLEQNEKPKSVYQFSKLNGFTESEFYTFFGTLNSIENEIYNMFLEKTVALLEKDANYETYDMKSKMLSFYFTFFELLSANRSYVVMSLKENENHLKNLMQLSTLRNSFKEYVAGIISDEYRIKQEKLQSFQEKTIKETSWLQLLMTLKFWLEDYSTAFEKTDIYFKKSVKDTFELMNIAPIDSIIDFGKFLFKEKIQSK